MQDTVKEVVQKVIDFVTFKSCNEPEEKPLTPEDIVAVLEGRGWEAEIVKAETIAGEFFKKFDADGDGNIDLTELRAGLKKELGVSYPFFLYVSSCLSKVPLQNNMHMIDFYSFVNCPLIRVCA